MKKLFLLICLCVVTGAQAGAKSDLAKAIRAIDASSVEQILTREKLTQREYNCYFDLAEEMVVERKAWMIKGSLSDDVTTPYEGPSLERILLNIVCGYVAIVFSGMFAFDSEISNKVKNVCNVGFCIGMLLMLKAGLDIREARKMRVKRMELLREKYDNAIAIKQLILCASIIEA